jgi:hypothetical protein
MSRQERSEYIRALLAIQFDDGNNYKPEELNAMSDEELQTAYDAETGDEKETCSICEAVKVCDYADDDTGEPICEDCASEIEASDSVPTDDGEDEDEDDEDESDGAEGQEEDVLVIDADEDDLTPIEEDDDEDDEDQDDTEEID